jgi:hypothetical protein
MSTPNMALSQVMLKLQSSLEVHIALVDGRCEPWTNDCSLSVFSLRMRKSSHRRWLSRWVAPR